MEIAHTKLKKSSLNKSKKYLEAKPQLSFYELPPTESISLQEFEEFAVERLKGKKVKKIFKCIYIFIRVGWQILY